MLWKRIPTYTSVLTHCKNRKTISLNLSEKIVNMPLFYYLQQFCKASGTFDSTIAIVCLYHYEIATVFDFLEVTLDICRKMQNKIHKGYFFFPHNNG